jgi:hypothetical protein
MMPWPLLIEDRARPRCVTHNLWWRWKWPVREIDWPWRPSVFGLVEVIFEIGFVGRAVHQITGGKNPPVI